MRIVVVGLLVLASGCARKPPPSAPVPSAVPPPVATTGKPPLPVDDKVVERGFKITKDGRSRERIACWPCYLNLRDELRHAKGVREVAINPDPGHVIIKYDRTVIADAAELVALVEKLFKGVECTALDDVPILSARVRLTRQVPDAVRVAVESLTKDRPVLVVKCVAPACRECKSDEPLWGAAVLRVDIDIDKTQGALAWLTPEAVPEWIALDRGGNELGRWRGRIEKRDFEARLADILSRAR